MTARPLLLLHAALAFGAMAAPAHAVTYGGRATVADGTAEVGVLTARVLFADTGELGAHGARRDAALGVATNPAPLRFAAAALGASTAGVAQNSFASASADDLVLELPGLAIAASAVGSQAEARCAGDAPALWARTRIENLVINGTAHTLGGGPDERITLPGLGTITFNEQLRNALGIEVRALHLRFDDGAGARADLIVARAQAAMTCA